MYANKGIVENGEIKIIESKELDQSSLTSDCWAIQFWGLDECKKCELRGTSKCGGEKTLRRMKKAAKN
jgi:hypothetical protein